MTRKFYFFQIPCNLNLAQCYIKLKEYKSAISHTSKVLEIEQDNVKALYRRGISYMALQEVILFIK